MKCIPKKRVNVNVPANGLDRLFSFISLDVIQVKKIAKKAKNTGHCTKILLHKKFKLILEQNVREQTYLKITFRLQKYSLYKVKLYLKIERFIWFQSMIVSHGP